MGKSNAAPKGSFPIVIRDQSVVVKIYRQTAKSNADGFAYVVTWVGPNGREKFTRADLAAAKDDAELKASQLAAGLSEAQQMSRSDVFEMTEAKAIVAPSGLGILSALTEWAAARELVGPAIVEACKDWAKRRPSGIQRIRVPDAVDAFIAAKDSAKKKGTRTYSAKLKAVKDQFADWYLDAVTVTEWTKLLNKLEDAVTRNDIRKRIVTLCRWAKRHGHLPEDVVPSIENTDRAKETAHPIGILEPDAYHAMLEYFRNEYPELLAALVVAGLCGVRGDEIHGKRESGMPSHGDVKRQMWEDIHLDRKFLSVTNAKENTPSNRIVHLSDAAVAWLNVCPGDRKGPICAPLAIDRIRVLARKAKFDVPSNCFRHSWITYRIALTGNKPDTATEAGNSVKEIDRRYRVPRPKADGIKWFSTRPSKR
jgi:hypothetical protein